MTDSRIRRGLIMTFGLGAAGSLASPALAQAPVAEEIVVTDRRYYVDTLQSPKYTRPLLDTPQSVTVVSNQLLSEQGRRNLRDSLRNITGISIQAGEGNPPSGDALKIRGFSARDDILIDGVRDVGNFFRDPFFVERIEVTKGPSSSVSGRGNVGGTINLVSRRPTLDNLIQGDLSIGSDDLYRATADTNFVLSQEHGIALRLSAMAHTADEPGRDTVENERWAIFPSIAYGLGGDTQITASWLHLVQDDLPDQGIPNGRNPSLAGSGFEGRPAPVDRDNFYGYTTDYRDTEADVATFRLDHVFSDQLALRSQLRYGRTHNDSVISSPRFVGNVTTLTPTTLAVGNRKPRDQVDDILINETDVTFDFVTGPFAHTLVAGFEVARETIENERRLDANGPNFNLFTPGATLAAAPIPYNGTRVEIETDSHALFLFDTIEITPQWLINFGVRHDEVSTEVLGIDDTGRFPGFVTDLTADDDETSWNTGLVFKPVPNASLYFAYGTGFETSGRVDIVQPAGGNNNPPVTAANFNVAPELSEAFEFGAKWNLLDQRLALAAAAFQTTKTNARTPGVEPGDPLVVLDGELRVRGFELNSVGALTSAWNIFAGYTYLDGEVTESNRAFEVGQELDNVPENSLFLWTSYQVMPALNVGGGLQYVAERTSDIRPSATSNFVITAPSYTVVDAFVEYALSKSYTVRLNGYNLADEDYFQSFQSGQSIPAASRSVVASLEVKF